jgi:hypothetical protein
MSPNSTLYIKNINTELLIFMKFNMNITAWSPTHLGPFYFLLPVPTMQVHEVGATLEPFLKFHMVTEL